MDGGGVGGLGLGGGEGRGEGGNGGHFDVLLVIRSFGLVWLGRESVG